MVATYTTLTSNVVVTAIQEGALQSQIDATKEMIDADAKMVEILQIPARQRLCERARPGGTANAARAGHSHLAAAGQATGAAARSPGGSGRPVSRARRRTTKFELSSLQLPQDMPVSLPSKLVAQRPDVLQAEENLHSASAQIGVAVANRLPNIELTRQRRQHGAGDRPDVRAGHRLLGNRRGTGRADFRRRKSAASGACRARRLRPGRRAISQHRADGVSERRRHLGGARAGCRRR